ncbi:MAG TPA: MFS transporter [Burkholderiaceae bacterium]|nr:MFS transporter [Burkholderiaceae bacterium]
MTEPAPAEPASGASAIAVPGALSRAFPWVIGSLIAVHACMAVTRVAASLWVLREGYGEWAVGVLLSLFAVAPIALALWAGRLADRHGFHRPVGLGVAMALGGALVAWASMQLWAIGLSSLLSGGAVAVAAVAIQREAGLMAADPSELKKVFSWVALGPALSNAIAPVMTGLLIDHAGFRWAFALAVALPVLAWWIARQVPRHVPVQHAGAARQRPAWALLKQPALRRLLLVNIVLSACWDAHSFVVPVVGHGKGLSASSIGLVLASFAVAATCVRLGIVRWGESLDELRALRWAMGLATLMLAVYAWLPGTPGLMFGSALLGLALGSVQPMVLSMLHRVTPHEAHGQALGLRMLMVNAATVSMPTGFGLLAAATLNAAPLWLMAVLLGAAQWLARGIRVKT